MDQVVVQDQEHLDWCGQMDHQEVQDRAEVQVWRWVLMDPGHQSAGTSGSWCKWNI
jgi:hypothetical protein